MRAISVRLKKETHGNTRMTRKARRETSARNAIQRRPPNVKCAAIVSAITTLVAKIKSQQIYAKAVSVRSRARSLRMKKNTLVARSASALIANATETPMKRSLNKSSN
jgi:hypothetical protein